MDGCTCTKAPVCVGGDSRSAAGGGGGSVRQPRWAQPEGPQPWPPPSQGPASGAIGWEPGLTTWIWGGGGERKRATPMVLS